MIYKLFAQQYGWPPAVVNRLTPAQADMYLDFGDEGQGPARRGQEDFANFLSRKYGKRCRYRHSRG